MQRILILGGGVGGTLTANLLVKKLRRRIDRGEVEDHGRRRDRPARLPAGLHVHRHGRRTGRQPAPSGARAARQAGRPWSSARSSGSTSHSAGRHAHRRRCRSATTSWCWRPGRGSCRRRSSTSTPRPTTSTPPRRPPGCAPRSTGSTAAGSSSASPGCPTSARRPRSRSRSCIEAELRDRGLRGRTSIDFCSPIGRAFTIESVSEMATPILEAKDIELHTFFNVEAIDPERKVVLSLEGEELGYDLLILVPPHKGAAVPDGLRSRPGARRLAADRPAHASHVADRRHLRARRRDGPAALEGRLDRALRGSGRGRADRGRSRGSRARPASMPTTTAR